MKLILHADDYGISKEISDRILECAKNNKIHRASIVCNTSYINEASLNLGKDTAVKLETGCHINLVEGKPVSEKQDVSLLINKTGEFKYSFISLWGRYIFSSRSKRKSLKQQVSLEIKKQIEVYKDIFPSCDDEIHIDGHTHIHMIPFVLDIILELSIHYNITSMRYPNEKFYFNIQSWRNYISSNILKYLILKILCLTQKKKIEDRNIVTNDYFIGILASGRMDRHAVKSSLERLKYSGKSNAIVEILFHPGGVNSHLSIDWTDKKGFIKYYSSKWRKKEYQFVNSFIINKLN
ncbi:carbohydrate deacetylase [Sphingobacterium sp. BIGb0165]|uniref:carbohydrate deacetylase n=1 Tax=Sphingobacterium sp. BIGb0165 TaxID=2940615 RepID=UPI0021670F88|nr:ChbG/HpnK family deacetylase [Sphingobacterium sp. BIGb0165]MCS4226918.1 putative glycoside hydrolase/deacetylase ChbG (UPF0249 family) [Sphingobacterium sp. BIGb0165]